VIFLEAVFIVVELRENENWCVFIALEQAVGVQICFKSPSSLPCHVVLECRSLQSFSCLELEGVMGGVQLIVHLAA